MTDPGWRDMGPPEPGTDRVLAQGTFDLLHPGHIHYLEEAATMGDELHVIVARGSNVTHKPGPVLPDRQRRDVVAAIGAVDAAYLGDPEDIFRPVEALDPAVIALGHDQHHDVSAIERALAERGLEAEVRRATAREPHYEEELLSTADIIETIRSRRD